MNGGGSKKRKCPLCGEEIPADTEMCPECGAHLDLFELEEEFDLEEYLTPLESFLDSIGDTEDVDPEKLIEEMKRIVGGTDEEIVEEPEGVPETETPEEQTEPEEPEAEEEYVEEEVEYVCPACGGVVGPEDDVCPHCGAVFAEAEEEVEEEEDIDYEKLLEETLEEAKSLIKTLRARKVDVSEITPFLKNANISRRKGNLEEALKNAEECVRRAKERL